MHKKNCFITLTYDDQNKPENNSLQKRDVTLFIKKLRKKYGSKIRFFMCGEYGSQLDRPHYHLCMFNHDFEDKKLWNVRDNVKLYRSKELEKLWPKGYTTIGDVTFESAAYVARYCLKKISGEKKEEHYGNRQPEYCNMSRRPGIGKAWWDKYKNDVLSTDKIYLRKGIIAKPPKYFDNQVEQKKLERIKLKRKKLINKEENNWERLAIKENIKKLQSKQLKRGLECRF
nr:MAG: replication initiator protein [Microviridae sp.]